jgi:hypothetical protein
VKKARHETKDGFPPKADVNAQKSAHALLENLAQEFEDDKKTKKIQSQSTLDPKEQLDRS